MQQCILLSQHLISLGLGSRQRGWVSSVMLVDSTLVLHRLLVMLLRHIVPVSGLQLLALVISTCSNFVLESYVVDGTS